jgi:hypothetical protein
VDYWQLSISLEDLLHCLDFSSAATGLALATRAEAQLLWEQMVTGIRQAVEHRGLGVVRSPALMFAIWHPSAPGATNEAAQQGQTASCSAAVQGVPVDAPVVRGLHWQPLEASLFAQLSRRAGQQQEQQTNGSGASAGWGATAAEAVCAPRYSSRKACLYSCRAGADKCEEVDGEQLVARLAAGAGVYCASAAVMAQLRQLAQQAGYQVQAAAVHLEYERVHVVCYPVLLTWVQ